MDARKKLALLYDMCQVLRDGLFIIGAPGSDLFENGRGWDGEMDHDMLVVADGLGGAQLLLMDQGCQTHRKNYQTEAEALIIASRLCEHAQGYEVGENALGLDEVEWD